jgi:hypothetical protein
MPIVWDGKPEDIFAANFQTYHQDVEQALKGICDYYAPQIEAWMKQNAPWQDQTGNARQSLHALADDLVNGAYVAFGHGVEYGIWLEITRAGVNGIVMRAFDHWGPLIWSTVEETFG